MAQVKLDWNQIKAVADARKLTFQWFQFETQYFIIVIDGSLEAICWLDISTPPLPGQIDFETNYKPRGNSRQENRIFNDRGGMIVDTDYRRGPSGSSAITLNTHCFGDRTTWFQNSARVVGETLTDTGNGLAFSAVNPHWINTASNRLSYTYKKWPTRTGVFVPQTTWAVNISIGGVLQNPSTYTVDFAGGRVTFLLSQAGQTVLCDYSHNNNTINPSEFLVIAPLHFKYVLENIEIQMSQNISFSDPIIFEVWAGPIGSTVNSFNHPQLGWFPGALYDAGYGQQRMIYRDIRDFLNMSNNTGSVALPATGGLTQPILIFPFEYVKAVVLDSQNAALIRLKLVNDVQIANCELGTCTFYMDVDPD